MDGLSRDDGLQHDNLKANQFKDNEYGEKDIQKIFQMDYHRGDGMTSYEARNHIWHLEKFERLAEVTIGPHPTTVFFDKNSFTM